MKLKIKITKDVLRKSILSGTSGHRPTVSCAVSVAVRDMGFPDKGIPRVDYSKIGIDGNVNIELPEIARDFINKFDSLNKEQNRKERLKLSEFDFEINVDDYYVQYINLEGIKNSETIEIID